jgi:hypothetical protein
VRLPVGEMIPHSPPCPPRIQDPITPAASRS